MNKETPLAYLEEVFNTDWLNSLHDQTLKFALSQHSEYRCEVNRWLELFHEKGWLTDKTKQRLRQSHNWPSYYSKINELRVGFFIEKFLGLRLVEYEAKTVKNKNVEFKCVSINEQVVFAEVKTPLNLERFGLTPQKMNNVDLIRQLIKKAAIQLGERKPSLVVLADDLNFPLLNDLRTQSAIKEIWQDPSLHTVSATCFMGGIFQETMYDIVWSINPHALQLIDENLFIGFPAMAHS